MIREIPSKQDAELFRLESEVRRLRYSLDRVLKASRWATKCLDPRTVEDKYPSGAFKAFRLVKCGHCKACLFAKVVTDLNEV